MTIPFTFGNQSGNVPASELDVNFAQVLGNPDVFNVKNYGALGNGTHDDGPDFNTALAAGKSVVVPAGTFRIATTVTLPSNTTLTLRAGAILSLEAKIVVGDHATLMGPQMAMAPSATAALAFIKQADGINLAHLIEVSGAFASVQCVVIDGNGANNVTAGPNIYYTSSRPSFFQVTSQNSNSHGIHGFSSGTTNAAGDAHFLECMIYNNGGAAIKIEGSADNFITACELEVAGGAVLELHNAPSTRVRGSDISGGGTYGIWVYGEAYNPGVSLGSYLQQFTDNQFGNNTLQDIYFDGANFGTFANQVVGNTFFASSNRAAGTVSSVKIDNNLNGANNVCGNLFYAPDPFTLKYGVEIAEASPGAEAWDSVTDNIFNGVFTTACVLPAAKTYVGQNQCYFSGASTVSILNLDQLSIGTQTTPNKLTIETVVQFDGIRLRNAANSFAVLQGLTSDNDGGNLLLALAGTVNVFLAATTGSYLNGGGLALGSADTLAPNGVLHLAPVTVPASPPSGFMALYVDTADNKLKAKASTGTVTTLASP